eukprot:3836205-Prymnesium_polylepis.2
MTRLGLGVVRLLDFTLRRVRAHAQQRAVLTKGIVLDGARKALSVIGSTLRSVCAPLMLLRVRPPVAVAHRLLGLATETDLLLVILDEDTHNLSHHLQLEAHAEEGCTEQNE